MAMRRWAIRHVTSYRYSVEVAFAPHLLRLTPRGDRVATLTRSLVVSPTPLQALDEVDTYGNVCTRLLFDGSRFTELRIDSYVEVETFTLEAPPAWPLAPLPWGATDAELSAFAFTAHEPDVAAFAASVAAEVGGDPVAFLERLTRVIHARTDRQLRLEGAAQSPTETLSSRSGACRDLSVLFLAACRSQGLAGRFVSGYQGQEQTPDGRRHLHAWAEIWLPGRGWVGWDPMHGIAIGPGHVALAAAPDQPPTMPVDGGYFFDGPSITSTLDYTIHMHPL
jgi:transglutaminase-like putative cysteine protease